VWDALNDINTVMTPSEPYIIGRVAPKW